MLYNSNNIIAYKILKLYLHIHLIVKIFSYLFHKCVPLKSAIYNYIFIIWMDIDD